MARIDEKTVVPLGIVAGLFSVGIGVTATGAMWVKGVNDRLARIEERLGISQEASNDLITPAAADVLKRKPNGK